MNADRDDFRRRKRRVKPGDVRALQRLLWETTLAVEELVRSGDADRTLKAASTVATLGGVYLRALEFVDLDKRLTEIEKRLARGDDER